MRRSGTGGGSLARRRRCSRAHGRLVRIVLPAIAVLATLSGCASAGSLAEYDFRGRTVAVVGLNTPRPEILTNEELDVDFRSPLQAALRIGGDLVKEVEAARARPRLDSAARAVDVGGRMMERVLHGVAGELRAVPVDDVHAADFEVEVQVKRYGIHADHWLDDAHYFIEAEVILRDAPTGRRIWKGKVKEREPLGAVRSWHVSAVGAARQPLNDVITAASLSSLSEGEMREVLQALADFSADRVLERFRKGLEKSRR